MKPYRHIISKKSLKPQSANAIIAINYDISSNNMGNISGIALNAN